MAGGGRFKAAADFGASEFKDLLGAGRDNVGATVFFPGAVVLVFPTSFRAADAETKGLTGCCVAVRLVLVTAVVVVVVALPVEVEAAADRGAEFTVDLLVLGAAVVLAVAEVLGLAAGAVAGLGAVDLGLVAALVAAVAGLLLGPEAVPTTAPVFVPAAVVVVVVVVDLLVPTVVTLGWGLEVATAVEEPTGFFVTPEGPLVVVGFFLSAAALVAGIGFLVRVLAVVFVRPLVAKRLWVALGLVPGPVVAGAAAVVLPLIGPLDLLLASTAFPEASFTFGGATCSFWGSSGCGGDCVVPF